ncbi:MAG: hypothetical protein ACO37V_06065, partial [Ilumatobacteraceae bacterium]
MAALPATDQPRVVAIAGRLPALDAAAEQEAISIAIAVAVAIAISIAIAIGAGPLYEFAGDAARQVLDVGGYVVGVRGS